MYENERKRARVGTPELIVTEESRSGMSLYLKRDWLLIAVPQWMRLSSLLRGR